MALKTSQRRPVNKASEAMTAITATRVFMLSRLIDVLG
jgi:hypothetical protein